MDSNTQEEINPKAHAPGDLGEGRGRWESILEVLNECASLIHLPPTPL